MPGLPGGGIAKSLPIVLGEAFSMLDGVKPL